MNNRNKLDEQLKVLVKKFKRELNTQFYVIMLLITSILILIIIVETSLYKQIMLIKTPPKIAVELPDIRKA